MEEVINMDSISWIECLSAGKRGEALVKAALDKHYLWVADVSENFEFKQKDIDLVVDFTTIEVKNDLKSNRTNNVFVELINHNNRKRGGRGWIEYCEADYMAFV